MGSCGWNWEFGANLPMTQYSIQASDSRIYCVDVNANTRGASPSGGVGVAAASASSSPSRAFVAVVWLSVQCTPTYILKIYSPL